jgi:hypothetical protein
MCNNKTRQECFDRKLFGAALKSKARKGDILVLYNFNNKTFDGPFMAAGDASFAIIEEAWGGNFKHQVRICNVLDREGNGKRNPNNHRLDFTTIDKKVSASTGTLSDEWNFYHLKLTFSHTAGV